jgi:hypothetical protein
MCLSVVRTHSILKVAKDKKIISKIRPIVEQMVQRGRWYSKSVIVEIADGLSLIYKWMYRNTKHRFLEIEKIAERKICPIEKLRATPITFLKRH